MVDAVDAMRAPLHAVVTGEAGGAAVAVLAAAGRRMAYRHARIRLAEPRSATVSGTADEVAAAAGRYLRELEELAVRLAEVTGQPRSRVEDDLSAGRMLTAERGARVRADRRDRRPGLTRYGLPRSCHLSSVTSTS